MAGTGSIPFLDPTQWLNLDVISTRASEAAATRTEIPTQFKSSTAAQTDDSKWERSSKGNVPFGTCQYKVVAGIVISGVSDKEVESLLSLFANIATVAAFIAGAYIGSLSSISISELNDFYDFTEAQLPGYWGRDLDYRMIFIGEIGCACCLFSIFLSIIMFVSLSSLNINTGDISGDEIFERWVNSFSAFYVLNFVFLTIAVEFLAFNLYFLGIFKIPSLAGSVENTELYGSIGYFFMVVIALIIVTGSWLHYRTIGFMRRIYRGERSTTTTKTIH